MPCVMTNKVLNPLPCGTLPQNIKMASNPPYKETTDPGTTRYLIRHAKCMQQVGQPAPHRPLNTCFDYILN
eukprot:6479616-Amphidinium_carterae.1